MEGFDDLEKRLDAFVPAQGYRHDQYIAMCIREALAAAKEGNFGVGAVLVHNGQVVQKGHNHVFHPYFQSDRHAEMDVITTVEQKRKGNHLMHKGYTLYTSVEPCTMCFARLITAGVGQVYYAADDSEGGMVHLAGNLPSAWKGILAGSGATFEAASCSPGLKELAMDVFLTTVRQLDKSLAQTQGDSKTLESSITPPLPPANEKVRKGFA